MNELEEIVTAELELAELRKPNSPGQTPEYWAALAELVKLRAGKGNSEIVESLKDTYTQKD